MKSIIRVAAFIAVFGLMSNVHVALANDNKDDLSFAALKKTINENLYPTVFAGLSFIGGRLLEQRFGFKGAGAMGTLSAVMSLLSIPAMGTPDSNER